MFRDKNFLMKDLGIGERTREDTLFILGALYDEIKENGITDEVIGHYLYIRTWLSLHREIINNKDYSIIGASTFLQKSNLILNKYNNSKSLNDDVIRDLIQKVTNDEYKSIPIDLKTILLEREEIIEDKGDKKEPFTGIYGIYIDDELVYIGRTMVGFKQRFEQHSQHMKNSDTYMYNTLRKYKEQGHTIILKPLVVLEKLQVQNKRKFNVTEVNCMELALITVLQPKLNIEGRLKPYVFRNK